MFLETATLRKTIYNETNFTTVGLNNTLSSGELTKCFPTVLQSITVSQNVLH